METKRLRGGLLAILLSTSMAACNPEPMMEDMPPDLGGPPPPQMVQRESYYDYQGTLPAYLPSLNPGERLNELGNPVMIDTGKLIAKHGEAQVRRSVGNTARVCTRIAMRKWAIQRAREQAAWTKRTNKKTRDRLEIQGGLNYGAAIASGIVGVTSGYGAPYGIMSLLSAFQSGNSNNMWMQQISMSDRATDMFMTLVELDVDARDDWYDLVGDYCGRFGNFVTQVNGKFVQTHDNLPNIYGTPSQSSPAASSAYSGPNAISRGPRKVDPPPVIGAPRRNQR